MTEAEYLRTAGFTSRHYEGRSRLDNGDVIKVYDVVDTHPITIGWNATMRRPATDNELAAALELL